MNRGFANYFVIDWITIVFLREESLLGEDRNPCIWIMAVDRELVSFPYTSSKKLENRAQIRLPQRTCLQITGGA